MSLTYIKQRSGPRIDPWGTPPDILHAWEYVPAISTICSLSLKYDFKNNLLQSVLLLVLLTC